jgi:hypothetical protein
MKNEKELIYGQMSPFEDNELIFMLKKSSIEYCRLYDVLEHALSNRMTWGQFEGKFPEVYASISERFFDDRYKFSEWLDDNYPDQLEFDVETVKNRYEDEYAAQRVVPLPEWLFKLSDLNRRGLEFWLIDAPTDGLIDVIPDEVEDKYGIRVDSITGEYFLRFKPEFEAEIVRDLEKHGYTCSKDQELVDRVFERFHSAYDLIDWKIDQ